MIVVTVRCLASLAAWSPPDGRLALAPGATVADAVATLGIPADEVGTTLRNGAPAEAGAGLESGDTLSVIPPITGG